MAGVASRGGSGLTYVISGNQSGELTRTDSGGPHQARLNRALDPRLSGQSGPHGSRPFHRWGSDGYALVKKLLDRGVDPNASFNDHSGNVAIVAAGFAPLEIIKLLIEHGTDYSSNNRARAISYAEKQIGERKRELSYSWNFTRHAQNKIQKEIAEREAVVSYLQSLNQ